MYVFDTNAVYYAADPAWTTAEQRARLQGKAEAGRLEIGLSPITVLEMASRIGEEPDSFEWVRKAAQIFITLKPKPLPDPELRMREITENVDLARQLYHHWYLILETIARAPDADALQRGFDDYASATRRSGNISHITRFRAEYEQQYVRDMLEVVRQINPNYDSQLMSGEATALPKSEQAALKTFFASPEWTAVFLSLLAYRGGTGLVPTDEGKLVVIIAKSHYFKTAYEMLGQSIFCNGARPNMKRKNDYNDIHQLLYVSPYTEDVLVSEDGGILSKVDPTAGKVLSFKAFLQIEAA